MQTRKLLILTQRDVDRILTGAESRIIQVVRKVYEHHHDEQTIVPRSAFLRLSSDTRAIALPACVRGDINAMGMKWVSSFPQNCLAGIPRACGTIVLNSISDGLPLAFMDGTLISAKRTAASAALAATFLSPQTISAAGFVGAGPINREIAVFLKTCFPRLNRFLIYDVVNERAEKMAKKLRNAGIDAAVASGIEELFATCPLVSFATSAVSPHITSIPSGFGHGTILHISLRDLSPELISSSFNLVDDAEHVCQHQTSLHLAEQLCGNRSFIHKSLGQLLVEGATSSFDEKRIKVFSPFGLGALDVALASFVYESAISAGVGAIIPDMFGLDSDD